MPTAGKPPAVLFVMEFPSWRSADVMVHAAAQGDGIDTTGLSRAKTKVNVFAAVPESFIETAELAP